MRRNAVHFPSLPPSLSLPPTPHGLRDAGSGLRSRFGPLPTPTLGEVFRVDSYPLFQGVPSPLLSDVPYITPWNEPYRLILTESLAFSRPELLHRRTADWGHCERHGRRGVGPVSITEFRKAPIQRCILYKALDRGLPEFCGFNRRENLLNILPKVNFGKET